ncbi:MAG: hypothetical protein MHM6MM_002010 [Cercozoa sp. M6MM]
MRDEDLKHLSMLDDGDVLCDSMTDTSASAFHTKRNSVLLNQRRDILSTRRINENVALDVIFAQRTKGDKPTTVKVVRRLRSYLELVHYPSPQVAAKEQQHMAKEVNRYAWRLTRAEVGIAYARVPELGNREFSFVSVEPSDSWPEINDASFADPKEGTRRRMKMPNCQHLLQGGFLPRGPRLPLGWVTRIDHSTGRLLYVNRGTYTEVTVPTRHYDDTFDGALPPHDIDRPFFRTYTPEFLIPTSFDGADSSFLMFEFFVRDFAAWRKGNAYFAKLREVHPQAVFEGYFNFDHGVWYLDLLRTDVVATRRFY